jgi:hypothetical protein
MVPNGIAAQDILVRSLCFHKFGRFWDAHRKDFTPTGPQNTGKTLTKIQAPSGIKIHDTVFGAIENTVHGNWRHIITLFVKNNLHMENFILIFC